MFRRQLRFPKAFATFQYFLENPSSLASIKIGSRRLLQFLIANVKRQLPQKLNSESWLQENSHSPWFYRRKLREASKTRNSLSLIQYLLLPVSWESIGILITFARSVYLEYRIQLIETEVPASRFRAWAICKLYRISSCNPSADSCGDVEWWIDWNSGS